MKDNAQKPTRLLCDDEGKVIVGQKVPVGEDDDIAPNSTIVKEEHTWGGDVLHGQFERVLPPGSLAVSHEGIKDDGVWVDRETGTVHDFDADKGVEKLSEPGRPKVVQQPGAPTAADPKPKEP